MAFPQTAERQGSASAGRQLTPSSILETSAIRCLKKDDTCRTAADLSDARLQSRPRQNPHSQCRSCRLDERATPAAPPEIQTPSPYRTGLSPHGGYPPAQCSGERLSWAYRAAALASCARKI